MQRYNKRNLRDMTILGGWLFADLLLALMVIFLAAQPSFPKPIPKTPTPSPTPTFTMTPTPVPRLDFKFHRFEMDNVDYNGILANNASAVTAVEKFINGRAELRNRVAGLVIVYDGANTDSDISTAQTIAQAVTDNVLKIMGSREQLLQHASYYNPLYLFGAGHNVVVLDIYLFQQ